MKNTDKYINGPINAIRLEGEINSVKKVLYIFFDIHVSVVNQTKCENIRSTDIQKYLQDSFDNISGTDKTYDLFVEAYPSDILDKTNNYKKRYIEEVNDLFYKSFKYEKTGNKVSKSDKFTNVRLHYADIRDYLHGLLDLYHKVENGLYDLNQNITNDSYFNQLENISSSITFVINMIYDLLFTKKHDGMKIKKQQLISTLKEYYDKDISKIDEVGKYIVDKIKNKYKNENVKTKIKILMANLEDAFVNYHKMHNDLISIIKKQKDKTKNEGILNVNSVLGNNIYYGLSTHEKLILETEIHGVMAKYSASIIEIISTIMDIYFMRRFLDKEYITNGIIYAGGFHGAYYLFNLIKYFDFKITHYSYLKNDNIEEITKVIENNKKCNKIIEYIFPEKLQQCSNMTNFPPNFE